MMSSTLQQFAKVIDEVRENTNTPSAAVRHVSLIRLDVPHRQILPDMTGPHSRFAINTCEKESKKHCVHLPCSHVHLLHAQLPLFPSLSLSS